MKTTLFYALVFAATAFLSCEKDSEKKATPSTPAVLDLPLKSAELISQSNSFGIDLFKKTSQVQDENLMLSPLSASTALTMLLNGCAGQTYQQIHQMLGYTTLETGEANHIYNVLVDQLIHADGNVKLALANAVWYRQNILFKAPFLDTMRTSFSARVEELDFLSPQALTTINGWASDNTFGKIPQVLSEISPDAVMFLMNALYFKGSWKYQFNTQLTRDMPFFPETGDAVNVPTMSGKMPVVTYAANNFTALELPYGRGNFSMLFLLPTEGTLTDFIEGFQMEDWNSMTQYFESASVLDTIEISIPKFKFSYEKVLNDQLQSMGMTDAFNPAVANLSGITDESVFVSFVKQNTYIEVNEVGTEAAAVTTIGIELTSMPNSFYANKPFVFVIREKTSNTILFIGKVLLPETE